MKTKINLTLRRFPVVIRNERTREVSTDTIVFDKETLNAAQRVGQSSKELIFRAYNRNGFKVLDIGKAERGSFPLMLDQVFEIGTLEANADDAG